MTSRRSSGSSRDDSAVEPIRSQNITLSGRRSAMLSETLGCPTGSTGEEGETEATDSADAAWECNAAIASNRRRRWPIGTTPISLRSSVVSLGNISASTAFSWNAAAYCSRPRLFSHPPTSTAVSSRLVMLVADYCGGAISVEAEKPKWRLMIFGSRRGEVLVETSAADCHGGCQQVGFVMPVGRR